LELNGKKAGPRCSDINGRALGDGLLLDCCGMRAGSDRWPLAGERFLVDDGRHDYLAALMLGREKIFVCWLTDVRPSPELPAGRLKGSPLLKEPNS
jgi:hypothetical protein